MSKSKKANKPLKKNAKEITLEEYLKGHILYDNVLIDPIVIESDGLVVRPQQYEDKVEFGKVLAIGQGRLFDNGQLVPLTVRVGHIVFFQKYSSQKVRVEGKDLLIIREEDIYWHN